MSQKILPRKRVVLKVWQKDGQVFDTASHIEWLERKGWIVACAEPLLDDPANGVAYISYLLEWKEGTTVPDGSVPLEANAPGTSVDLQANSTTTVQCPTSPNTVKVVLLAHVTRGRMKIHDFDNNAIVMDLSTVPERGPLTSYAQFDRNVPGGIVAERQFLVMSHHDVEPSPEPPPPPPTWLPDASPAILTLDACFVHSDPTKTVFVRLKQQKLRPGDFCNFYVVFKFI